MKWKMSSRFLGVLILAVAIFWSLGYRITKTSRVQINSNDLIVTNLVTRIERDYLSVKGVVKNNSETALSWTSVVVVAIDSNGGTLGTGQSRPDVWGVGSNSSFVFESLVSFTGSFKDIKKIEVTPQCKEGSGVKYIASMAWP